MNADLNSQFGPQGIGWAGHGSPAFNRDHLVDLFGKVVVVVMRVEVEQHLETGKSEGVDCQAVGIAEIEVDSGVELTPGRINLAKWFEPRRRHATRFNRIVVPAK